MNFITKSSINYPAKIPDTRVLDRCIRGLSKRIRHESNDSKRDRLKIIRDEFKALKELL